MSNAKLDYQQPSSAPASTSPLLRQVAGSVATEVKAGIASGVDYKAAFTGWFCLRRPPALAPRPKAAWLRPGKQISTRLSGRDSGALQRAHLR